MSHDIKALRKKAMSLPLRPGVYIMRNSKNEIIYIGKAKALKNRVSQYFGSQENHTVKVRRMVQNVEDFDYIVTDSEYEALVLECSLIKQHSPKYNILLKDDKGYSYVRVSKEDYPRMRMVRRTEDDGAFYMGPYTSGSSVRQAVDEACRIFRLPTCSRKFPRDFGKGRPCLNYSIKQCMGVCRGRVSKEEYNEAFSQALDFLRSDADTTIKVLTAQMEECAENLEFEKAAKLRDRIAAIRKIREKQKVVMTKIEEQDVIAAAVSGNTACVEIMRYSGGRLYEREHFLFEEPPAPEMLRGEFIARYYSARDHIAPRIFIDIKPDGAELLEHWLTEQKGRKVTLTVPMRGEQLELVAMCRKNAAEHLSIMRGKFGDMTETLDDLMRMLGLPKAPEYIESYDISNTAGEANVAGMVVFRDGKPLKSAYRKFKIKGFEGQDDYGSMREVITRRFDEYFAHKGEEGFGTLPDLILLDGGEQHVAAVKPIIDSYGLSVPVFGMVKDQKHRTRAISALGEEVSVAKNRQVFTLIGTIQEEVHRFAISYHRKTRAKGMAGSSLTAIDGIGETRAKALLKHFKTITAIKNASEEELAAVAGMTKTAAKAVYEAYHRDDTK